MIMIMPAEFENKTKEILDSDMSNDEKTRDFVMLMEQVLKSLGYEAAVNEFVKYMVNQ